MMISNFVYEKQGAKRKKVMKYRTYMPQNKIFTWKEMNRMPLGKYILMHSVIYRTGLLRDCGLELPKHTFMWIICLYTSRFRMCRLCII